MNNQSTERQQQASRRHIERLIRDLEAIDDIDTQGLPPDCAETIESLHAAELADLMEALSAEQRPVIWQAVPTEERGELLTELHGEVRQQLIDITDAGPLAAALLPLQLDELADLAGQLPADAISELLDRMDPGDRRRFEDLRSYPEDSAGGLMDVDALTAHPKARLGEIHDMLRQLHKDAGGLPEHTDAVFVIDDNGKYLGKLALSDLVALPADTPVREAMLPSEDAIPVSAHESEVARRFEDRDLLSAPVVDDRGRLIGRITVDDIVDVIRRQGESALLGMAGMDEDVDMFPGTFRAARRRALWLGLHLLTAFLAAWVIGRFEQSIQSLVALAVLMPVVAGMGGVAGNQSLALVTRGLALDQVGMSNAPRLLASELSVAILNGLFWSLVVAVVVYFWFGSLALAAVFGLALTCNLLNGAFTGTWLPLLLSRLGIDPAIAGGVLLVAATDIFGFLIFLGTATVLLI